MRRRAGLVRLRHTNEPRAALRLLRAAVSTSGRGDRDEAGHAETRPPSQQAAASVHRSGSDAGSGGPAVGATRGRRGEAVCVGRRVGGGRAGRQSAERAGVSPPGEDGRDDAAARLRGAREGAAGLRVLRLHGPRRHQVPAQLAPRRMHRQARPVGRLVAKRAVARGRGPAVAASASLRRRVRRVPHRAALEGLAADNRLDRSGRALPRLRLAGPHLAGAGRTLRELVALLRPRNLPRLSRPQPGQVHSRVRLGGGVCDAEPKPADVAAGQGGASWLKQDRPRKGRGASAEGGRGGRDRRPPRLHARALRQDAPRLPAWSK
mmetsp:Transcript_48917/g.161995  ORF Transcript_48917/g.161995 Transcript_48917/m.161995 type:complete len:321 (+) Transcript_48917:193-1155(+)